MRLRSVLAAAIVAVGIAGCGSGGESSDPATGVRRTVHAFVNYALNGSYVQACSLFSDDFLNRLGGRAKCPEETQRALRNPSTKRELQQLASRIDQIPITAHGILATPDTGTLASFVKQKGRWLINSL